MPEELTAEEFAEKIRMLNGPERKKLKDDVRIVSKTSRTKHLTSCSFCGERSIHKIRRDSPAVEPKDPDRQIRCPDPIEYCVRHQPDAEDLARTGRPIQNPKTQKHRRRRNGYHPSVQGGHPGLGQSRKH